MILPLNPYHSGALKQGQSSSKQRLMNHASPYLSSSEDEEITTEEHFGGNYNPHGGKMKRPIEPKTLKEVLMGPTKEEKRNFKKSMKQSNLYYKRLVLENNIQKFLDEKDRKEKMIIDSEIFFRK